MKNVIGAHWDKVGAVTEVLYREKVDRSPLLLFDEVPGYEKDSVAFMACSAHPCVWRWEWELIQRLQVIGAMLDAYRSRIKKYEPVAPRIVSEGGS